MKGQGQRRAEAGNNSVDRHSEGTGRVT
jgi:hypothetical protein